MATSGTVGQTTLDTATLLEHVFRRLRVHPSKQTPEKVEIAKNTLFLLLSSLSNSGLNLWAITRSFVGTAAGQAVYPCPVGTIDILNMLWSTPTRETGTDASDSTSITTALTADATIVRIGVQCSTITASDTLTLAYSADSGSTWTTISTETKTNWAANTWYWFELDPSVTSDYFKASFGSAATFSEFYLASNVRDLPLTPLNRDSWMALPNKHQQGSLPTNYYSERLLAPQYSLWPVPNSAYSHVTLITQREIQDVGTLAQTIEVPNRWLNAIIWQVAATAGIELEEVDLQVLQFVGEQAERAMLQAGVGETDGAPFYITPSIGRYTR